LEFNRLLAYTDGVDLAEKLAAREECCNGHRPHGGLGGFTPYEVLTEKTASWTRAKRGRKGHRQDLKAAHLRLAQVSQFETGIDTGGAKGNKLAIGSARIAGHRSVRSLRQGR
jgi:hypothetical protein